MTPPYEINGEPADDAGEVQRRTFPRENWYRDLWLIVVTALVAFALLSFESNQRDLERFTKTNRTLSENLCGVVINVHKSSEARVKAERQRLKQTRIYLRTLAPDEVGTTLTKRVRQSVPNIVADVRAAKKAEVATRPPKECLHIADGKE